jgi:hypothetical protein
VVRRRVARERVAHVRLAVAADAARRGGLAATCGLISVSKLRITANDVIIANPKRNRIRPPPVACRGRFLLGMLFYKAPIT